MAKRKNKKNRQNASLPPSTSQDGKKGGEQKTLPKTGQTETHTLIKNEPAKQICRVKLSTCLAGMFLTLVLGLYLGSLVPEMMNGIFKTADIQPAPSTQSIPQIPEKQKNETPVMVQDAHPIPDYAKSQIDVLEKQLADNPASPEKWTELGNIYFDFNPHKAITAYNESLRLKPDNPDVLTDLGIMYREEHKFNQALECFQKAIDIDPRHANGRFNMGVVLAYDLNKKSDAVAAWEKLMEIYPNFRSPDGRPLSELIHEMRSAG